MPDHCQLKAAAGPSADRKRTDRVISLNGDTFAKLAAEQERLYALLGFKPTLAQVIDHLLSR